MESKEPRTKPGLTAAALLTLFVGRWLALGATVYFSFFHWMRSEYLVFSHVWQYGLPLLDPRVTAALLWALQFWVFLVLLVLPAARWLAARLPFQGTGWWLAAAGLSLALGTRGVVGPLVTRAVTAHPVRILPGGGEDLLSPLTEVHLARWIVALTEAWWLVPLLAVALRQLENTPVSWLRRGWPLLALLGLYALLQAPDAPYLLTGGGPRGATTNLQLLAFQLAFGAQEFGYASVLTTLLCCVGLLGGGVLLRALRTVPPSAERPAPRSVSPGMEWSWVMLPAASLVVLALAWSRNPPETSADPQFPIHALTSFAGAIAAAGWSAVLIAALWNWMRAASFRRVRTAWALLPVVFPPLVWVLPAVRVLGEQQGGVDVVAGPAGLVFGVPYLYLGLAVLAIGRCAGLSERRAMLAAGAAVAWGTWTDLTLSLMLTQQAQNVVHLPSAMVWNLSLHLWRSPLSVPGWPIAWLGGTLFALATLTLLHERPPQPAAAGVDDELDDPSQPAYPSRA